MAKVKDNSDIINLLLMHIMESICLKTNRVTKYRKYKYIPERKKYFGIQRTHSHSKQWCSLPKTQDSIISLIPDRIFSSNQSLGHNNPCPGRGRGGEGASPFLIRKQRLHVNSSNTKTSN